MMRLLLDDAAKFVIPLMLVLIPLYGIIKRVPVYEEFVTGAKEPALVGSLVDECGRRDTRRQNNRSSEGNTEVGTVERRFGVTTGEIGHETGQHHPANAPANRPRRTHLLVADQTDGSGRIQMTLETAPVVVAEGPDDQVETC